LWTYDAGGRAAALTERPPPPCRILYCTHTSTLHEGTQRNSSPSSFHFISKRIGASDMYFPRALHLSPSVVVLRHWNDAPRPFPHRHGPATWSTLISNGSSSRHTQYGCRWLNVRVYTTLSCTRIHSSRPLMTCGWDRWRVRRRSPAKDLFLDLDLDLNLDLDLDLDLGLGRQCTDGGHTQQVLVLVPHTPLPIDRAVVLRERRPSPPPPPINAQEPTVYRPRHTPTDCRTYGSTTQRSGDTHLTRERERGVCVCARFL